MNTFMYRKYICITNKHLVSGSGGAECTMNEYITQIEKCVALHPYAMILREKDMDRQDYRELARRIQIMCREASVKMFVHSDISAAEYAGCGNVHFSMEHFKQMCDEQADVIKRLDCVSVSCHSMEEAVNAVRAGADQIVLGTIFETQCKPGKMAHSSSSQYLPDFIVFPQFSHGIPIGESSAKQSLSSRTHFSSCLTLTSQSSEI